MVTGMTEQHDGAPEPATDEELFVEFVNTLELSDGQPDEHIPDAAALRAWLTAHELPAASLARLDAALPAFRQLRSLIHGITGRIAAGEPLSAAQLRQLNRVLRDGQHYHQLVVSDDGSAFSVGQVGDEVAQARAAIANSLAHYLADHDLRRMRVCANDGCRWRFIDRSPAGRRRWCDMRTCGNRAKVARHRARARGASA
jgi:predicted RNA-binding Zn ribbon-like protein